MCQIFFGFWDKWGNMFSLHGINSRKMMSFKIKECSKQGIITEANFFFDRNFACSKIERKIGMCINGMNGGGGIH